MPFYSSSEQLVQTLEVLFGRIHRQDAAAAQAVSDSRLIIRLRISAPTAVVMINGRKSPPQITYKSAALRPDLDIDLPADSLHSILLSELTLTKALAAGQMKVRGPVWKSFVLEGIFRHGQALYPQLLHELGMNGSKPASGL